MRSFIPAFPVRFGLFIVFWLSAPAYGQDKVKVAVPVNKQAVTNSLSGVLPSTANAAIEKPNVILTSPGVASAGFRRVPPKGGVAAPETLFPVGNSAVQPHPVATGGISAASGTTGGGGGGAGGGAGGGGAGAGGAGGATTGKPAPTTTFPGYLVGSPYPFVLPPPDIPYFGSKWNGPWGYPIGHYQAFRGTGQYITHYQYYPLSYFGSLMAPFAYGVSGKR